MNTQTYKFDDFLLAPKQRKLFYLNSPVTISSKAFEILLMLIERRGEIVEKDEFLNKIWADSFVEESNLVVHMSALRRILLEKKGERKFIETVSGRGYSFVAPVEEIAASEKSVVNEIKSAKPAERKNNSPISIAVLPIAAENLNEDIEYLANGVTQSLIDLLSQISTLKVMAYSAVAGYKTQSADLQEVGFLLGVDNILSGRISEYKNQIEIRVELIDTKDKRLLWGMNYDCQFDDIFRVKKEISLAIAESLKLKLTAADENKISREQTNNSEAYKTYLKGKYIIDRLSTRRNREESLYQALDFFRQALKLDANFALAYTGIGNVYNSLFNHDFLSREKSLAEARKALNLALKLDENLSETYLLKGKIEMTFDRDFLAARQSLLQAVKLNPSNSIAYHWLSLTYLVFEEFDEAVAMQNNAINYDPVSVFANYGLAKTFYFTGDFSKAIIQAEETLDLDHRYVTCFYILALSYSKLGIHDEAVGNAERAVEIQPLKELILTLAYVYAAAGETDKATEKLNEILGNSKDGLIDFLDVAAVYHGLKNKEKTFEYLNKAYETGSVNICGLRVDWRFENLRNEPEFNYLLEKLKLI